MKLKLSILIFLLLGSLMIYGCFTQRIVKSPTINPPSDGVIFQNSVSVFIQTTTTGANIYYTLDGSEPDEDSNLFGGRVPLFETTTVKARAYKSGLFPSAITTATYEIIQNELPEVNIVSPSATDKYFVGDTILISAEVSDPDGEIEKVEFSFSVSYPGGGAGALLRTFYNEPYMMNFNIENPGVYIFEVKAYDDKGGIKTSFVKLTITEEHYLGDPNAPVTMIVYADFEEPYSRTYFSQTEHQILEEYVFQGRELFLEEGDIFTTNGIPIELISVSTLSAIFSVDGEVKELILDVPTTFDATGITIKLESTFFISPNNPQNAALMRFMYGSVSDIKYVYKHYNLETFYPNGLIAALASECAGEQGFFWEYKDIILSNPASTLSKESLISWAESIEEIDMLIFNNCLDKQKYLYKLEEDKNEGIQKGATGVPSFWIENELISGAQSYQVFRNKINSCLSGGCNSIIIPNVFTIEPPFSPTSSAFTVYANGTVVIPIMQRSGQTITNIVPEYVSGDCGTIDKFSYEPFPYVNDGQVFNLTFNCSEVLSGPRFITEFDLNYRLYETQEDKVSRGFIDSVLTNIIIINP